MIIQAPDALTSVDELMQLCDQPKTRINTAQTTQIQLADTISQSISTHSNE